MFGFENEVISSLSANIGKLLFGLGLIYIILKIIDKRVPISVYRRFKGVLYQIHINAMKFATVFAFVHSFFIIPETSYWLTGWLVGGSMVLLLVIGAYMSIKLKEPMKEAQDQDWKQWRVIKWMVTAMVILFIALHYFWV